jgi:signal transduction histidine kinase
VPEWPKNRNVCFAEKYAPADRVIEQSARRGGAVSPRHRSSAEGEQPERRLSRAGSPGSFLGRLVGARTIRGRLVRILVVSVGLVIALLGVTIAGEVGDYTAAGQTRDAVSLALTVQDTTQEIQKERGLTNGILGGESRFVPSLAPQRVSTDKALNTLNLAITGTGVSGSDRVKTALGRLSTLNSVRQGVDARSADRATTFAFYTDAIAALNQVDLGFDQAQDAQLRKGLLALGALADAKEATGQERGFLNGVFAAGRFNAGEYIKFTEIRAAKQAALASFSLDSTPARQTQLDGALASPSATQAAAAENIAIAAAAGQFQQSVDPVGWWNEMTTVINQMRTVQQSVGADLQARATQLRDDATTALIVFLALALLAVALELTLVIGALRSIVRPLASLAVEADDVAARRLPAAVAGWHTPGGGEPAPPEPVRTPSRAGTEIASVAAALDRVQTTAFELAGEQALLRRNTTESLANLGRRNQNLVRRQLGFISEFEREELDPTALANLFELDHLATRMRRNAESLLVLVSESSPRRWAKPLAVTEVVRAALSEVEDYRRAALRRMDEVAITGSMVNELAHMLAELLENALAFSPPDLEVEVYGRKLGSKYMLAVVDHGVGMSREQLDRANARLRGEEDFIVAPTRFLGHYVVGQLAQRLGVEVELTVSPVNGIVARLLLPEELLTTEDASPPVPPVVRKPAPVKAAPAPEPIQWPKDDEEPESVFVPRQEKTVSPPVPPEPTPSPPAAAERTRNGLIKRAPKRASGAAKPAVKAAEPRPESAVSTLEPRSPDDVRSMLSKFRSGHERGAAGEKESR